MTFYHPAMRTLVGHHLQNGFLSMDSLMAREHPQKRYGYNRTGETARTIVFDTPERAAEWWEGAYGTKIEVLQIDGDVTIEEGNIGNYDGMFFLLGEIPADQVSLYEAAAPTP
ncbi:hypothetical protein G6L37_07165 [Agrobacterium rubi]|nr:hypothetical protein [Agrobacterium rubi]NTF25146.1 hypothetical protein [Agrobacterium rubi]